MRARNRLRLWQGLWVLCLLIGHGIFALYAWLPADGATGDLESFSPKGFRVQWLLEEQEGGLQVGDVIVRAGGHTVDEWLAGATRGPEWRTGGIVPYEVLRDDQLIVLQIRLSPVSFRSILLRWGAQFAVSCAFFLIGLYVFWKRPQELPARLLMLFCTIMMLQYWADAYNFQYATLPWRWPFWFHLTFEHGFYSLAIATVCYFALVFPTPHPLVRRFPRLMPFVLYAVYPVGILGGMALSPSYSAAMGVGNNMAWILAIVEIGLAIGAGIHSVGTARDPVSRAQVRWILWSACVGCAVMLPSYVLPMIVTNRAPLPHPISMLLIAFIPVVLAIAILRYRLFDIEIIINRTLVYAALTVLLGGLYLVIVRLSTVVIQMVAHQENDTLVVFIATMSTALAFAPLRQRVQLLIDRAFYRTKLDYQRLLPEMTERLATSIVLDELSALLTDELPQRLHIAWATLGVLDPTSERFIPIGNEANRSTVSVPPPVFDDLKREGRPLLRLQPQSDLPAEVQEYFERNGIEVSIPLSVGAKQVGLYNLGSKLSGDAYSREEVRLLHLLGKQASVAIENAQLYKQAQQEISERKRAEERIKASLAEKEVLLKEIHHRVKNNLQVISSLLFLQSKSIKEQEILEIFQDSQSRVRSMALVHEKLYQSQDLARIDFGEYVRSLANYLLRSYSAGSHRVELAIDIAAVFLSIDTAIPCGLILNELISNSLRHAFLDGRAGKIHVELQENEGGQLELTVSDNGTGLSEELDFRNTTSLGLQLVNSLVRQLDGAIALDRQGGTTFQITFVDPA